MSSTWSCKSCIGSDPTQDTVKVDPALFARGVDKENTKPLQCDKSSAEAEHDRLAKEQKFNATNRSVMEQERREQAERRRKEQEAADADRAAAVAAEHEQWLRQAAKKEAEERTKKEADERRKAEAVLEAAEAAAALAAAAEKERQLVEAEAAALVAAQEKVNEWCKSKGFQNMSSQKKTLRGATKFPLHTAVKHKNEQMIDLLLKCGVDQHAKDSKKQTAGELATKMNKNGSHDQILAMLC